MSNEIAHPHTPSKMSPEALALLKRTIARDLEPTEFALFCSMAQRLGADPIKRQIRPILFNKKDPAKRQMIPVLTRDFYRSLAQRHGDYRPAEKAPTIDYDEQAKSDTNPLGIVRAEVTVFKKHSDGWHPIVGEAYWDEFAPLEEEWGDDPNNPGRRCRTGKKTLAENWRRMPRLMIAKVAEVAALRAGWPDDYSGVYSEEEMERAERAEQADLVLASYEEEQRIQRVGAHDGLLFVFDASGIMENVPRGQVADRLMALTREAKDWRDIATFCERNKHSLQHFWAIDKSDALEIREAMDARMALLRQDETEEAGD